MDVKNEMNQIADCEVCGSRELTPVLDLGPHPMCDDLIPIEDERECKAYPIDILFCHTCRTAHQKYQVPKHDLFPSSYHYRSRFTADVLTGMEQLVANCSDRFGSIEGKLVLDIGCNDGSLLDAWARRGARTVGIEPTNAALDAKGRSHVIHEDYLTKDLAAKIVTETGQPDFISFTNVFAHIEDLGGVLDALRVLMSDTTVLVIENHYLGAVLDLNQFDTFYHEHPRTYSFTSFTHIAKTLGVGIVDVEFPSRYGGNIRVFMAQDTLAVRRDHSEVFAREEKFLSQFAKMNDDIRVWRANKRKELVDLAREYGPLPAKAFPGRSAILVKLLDLDTDVIECVYEKPGSMKIGHFVPSSRIPIKSDDDFAILEAEPKVLINFAWHISSEIHAYLRNRGFEGKIVDLM